MKLMKKVFVVISFLLFMSVDYLSQCEGLDSRQVESFIEQQKRLETQKNQKKRQIKNIQTVDPSIKEFLINDSSANLQDLLGKPERRMDLRSVSYSTGLDDWGIGFNEGLTKVDIDGKTGYINRNGQIVIRSQYNLGSCFSNGLAAVRIRKKWGFINKKGELVIQAKFDAVSNYSEGLALVKIGKFWGYIDKIGKTVIEPKFEEASSFAEGTAVIGFYDKNYVWTSHQRANGKWQRRFIDKTGNWLIDKDFDGISRNFDGGMAIVSRNLGYSEKYQGVISETYIIDKKGNELWTLQSWYITSFSDDMIVVAVSKDEQTKRDKYSFLDRNGKRITEKVYDNLDNYSEGLAVATVNGKDGFIDKTGEFVIEPIFFSAKSFSEGLAAVWKDGESGFIDKHGNWQIKLKFNSTEGFREGFAAIEKSGKIGYINKQGKYIWKPKK